MNLAEEVEAALRLVSTLVAKRAALVNRVPSGGFRIGRAASEAGTDSEVARRQSGKKSCKAVTFRGDVGSEPLARDADTCHRQTTVEQV